MVSRVDILDEIGDSRAVAVLVVIPVHGHAYARSVLHKDRPHSDSLRVALEFPTENL